MYTFLSTCQLCTICLFSCFLSNSILFWWVSVIYFNFRATLFWLCLWHILKAFWNSMKRHLNISINSKVLFFPYKNVIEKIKHLHMTNRTLVLNYLTPASLCYNNNFPMLSFFNPSRSIHWCFIKKIVRIFRAPTHY